MATQLLERRSMLESLTDSKVYSVERAVSASPEVLSTVLTWPGANNRSAARVMAGLGHTVRLDVVRILSQHGPAGLSAGRIAARLMLAPSSLSFHLNHMVREHILIQRRLGRQIIYSANRSTIAVLCLFLEQEMVKVDSVAVLDGLQNLPGNGTATKSDIG